MKIEKYESINNGQYKIYLSDGTILKINSDVIINNNLLYKKEIDNTLLNKILKENDNANIYNKCVKYISVRLRSKKEIIDYLKKLNIDNTADIIDKLTKNNLINDEVFTKAFIKDKINFTSYGPYRIRQELNKYNIDNEIIDKYIKDIDEEILIGKIDKQINKMIKSNRKYSSNILKSKIYNNLYNNGFDKDMIINILNNYNF
ncbi:regulatory protein RecX [Clostridium sp. CAG:914]|jgi:regulatory protein|nr:regulatory protein RecX [Clostridium sp. CAG:914]